MAVVTVTAGTTDVTTILGTVVDGDTVIFGEGSQTVTAGLTKLSDDGREPANLLIGSGFNGNIGGSSGSLKASVTTLMAYGASGGSCYIWAGGTGTAIARLKAISSGGALYATTGGTLTLLEVGSGSCYVAEAVVATTIKQSGGTNQVLYNATGVTTYEQSGGSATLQRGATTLTQYAGNMVIGRTDTSATAPTYGTVTVGGNFKGQAAVGNITSLNIVGNGIVNFSECRKDFTIGTLSGSWDARKRSILKSQYCTITITTTNDPYGGPNDTAP